MKKVKKSFQVNTQELLRVQHALKKQNAELKALHEKEIKMLKRANALKQFMFSRLQLIIESIQYSILVIDENDKIEFINELCCEQFNIEKKTTKWLGCGAKEFLIRILPSYANQNAVIERVKKFVSAKQIVLGEEVLMKNGQTFLVDFIPLIVNGRSAGRMWIHRNITERKQYEALLKQSHAQYTSIIDNMSDGFCVIDVEGNILEVNDAYCIMSGFSKADLLKKSVLDVEFFDSGEQMKKKINELIKKRSISFDGVLTCTNGEKKYVEVHATYLIEFNYVFAFFKDITQRKSTEKELIKLSKAVMQSPVSIIITDSNGHIEYANPKLLETSGYSLEELIGKTPRLLNSGYHIKEYFENMWDVILSGNDWVGEICNKRKNGQTFWENSTISPIVNEHGDITNYVNVKIDITEKKRMVEELIEAKEKAEKSDKLKSEFLSQMSHEIRTPMNALLNFTTLLKGELKKHVTAETIEYIEGINSSGQRLIRTVDLLLNVSEVLAGTYKATFLEIDLAKGILDKIKNEYLGLVEEKGLQFNLVLNSTSALITADEYSVYKIFENLIDNAVKYTAKGAVTIKVEKIDLDLKVSIEDTGIGISEEFMSNMFKPFTQEDSGYSKKYEGNGLGLTLVKKYCDLNGIGIEVESKKQIGTKFTLTFYKAKQTLRR